MKPSMTLIVLSALVSSTVWAQEYSLTLYGRANMTLEQQSLGDSQLTGMFSNASRVGIQATGNNVAEDINIGVNLEAGFNLDTGNASNDSGFTFNRQSELNLSGSWGMVRVGKFYAESYYATADYISLHNHDTGVSSDALYVYVMRDDNKLAYRTPTFHGVRVEAAYSFPENTNADNTDDNPSAWDVALNYDTEHWTWGMGYAQQESDTQLGIRGFYKGDHWRLGAYAQHADVSGERFQTYRIALMRVHKQWEYHLNTGIADRDNAMGAVQATFGVNYNLNTSAKIYALYTVILNESHGDYGYSLNDELATNQPQIGEDFRSLAVGLRYNF